MQGAKEAAAAEARRAEAALEREAAARQQLEERHSAFLKEVREGLARVDEEVCGRAIACGAECEGGGGLTPAHALALPPSPPTAWPLRSRRRPAAAMGRTRRPQREPRRGRWMPPPPLLAPSRLSLGGSETPSRRVSRTWKPRSSRRRRGGRCEGEGGSTERARGFKGPLVDEPRVWVASPLQGEVRTLREESTARWQQLSAETLAESAARAEGERALGDAVKDSLKDREGDLQVRSALTPSALAACANRWQRSQELRQHQERSSEALEEVLRAEVRARVSAERRLQQRVEALAQSVGRAVETVRDDASQRIVRGEHRPATPFAATLRRRCAFPAL